MIFQRYIARKGGENVTVPGVQSALSVKNAGVEMLTESAKTQAVSGSDQFGAVMQQSIDRKSVV